jgi:phosphoglycerate dehydrogenase-like enzyme
MRKILITDALRRDLPVLPFDHIVRFPEKGPEITDGLDAEALVVWATPRPVLHALIGSMPNLKWVQAVMAGVDHILSAPLPPEVLVTNGKGLHDAPTAELAVALLLSGVRGLHIWRDNQHKAHWDNKAYGGQLNTRSLGTLEGATVFILGMGSIGLEIARRLQPFGAQVEGIATTAGTRYGFVTHAMADMKKELARADALISILPETPVTRGLINADVFAAMKPTAWFVNAGRGSSVDEAALLAALQQKRIAGAAIDVASVEPLPPESPLWKQENLIISPHVAGGGPRFYDKAMGLLQRNAEAYIQGLPLENRIDPAKGY